MSTKVKAVCLRMSLLLSSMICLVFGVLATLPLCGDAKYVVEKGIVFGRGGDVDLRLNLARPAEKDGPFPALVILHSGGWSEGNREECDGVIVEGARRGYVAISADYRLTDVKENGVSKYPFPCQVHDVKSGIRWLRANASKYNIDTARIGVMGFSAGGHLALMVGLTDSSDDLEGKSGNEAFSSRVQAIVSMAGMVEAFSYYQEKRTQKDVLAFLGGTPDQVPDEYRAASPLTYVSKESPPVLFMIGAKDLIVSPDQGKQLAEKMQASGSYCDFVVKEGFAHQAFYYDERVWSFFADHLLKDTQ